MRSKRVSDSWPGEKSKGARYRIKPKDESKSRKRRRSITCGRWRHSRRPSHQPEALRPPQGCQAPRAPPPTPPGVILHSQLSHLSQLILRSPSTTIQPVSGSSPLVSLQSNYLPIWTTFPTAPTYVDVWRPSALIGRLDLCERTMLQLETPISIASGRGEMVASYVAIPVLHQC